MRIDDKWGKEALSIIKGIDANVLVTSLNRSYAYDECKQFDLIASCTTGTDHIDNQGIPLICLKGETKFLQSVYATAEHTFGLILSLVRRIPFAHNDVCKGNWEREAWQGSELHGKTLGIVGYGRVGKQVARFAEAFGMNVIINDNIKDATFIKKPQNERVRIDSLKDVLHYADIITVHVSLNEETRGMFGMKEFKQMKPTAYFINTSRGAVIEEGALLSALLEKRIAGAALDVATGEPDIWEQLRIYARTENNLILTPHCSGNTRESREKTQIFLANRIKDYINTKESVR